MSALENNPSIVSKLNYRISDMMKVFSKTLSGATSLVFLLSPIANAQTGNSVIRDASSGRKLNLAETVAANPELSTLVSLASICNLIPFFADPNTRGTLFAPNNDAFKKLFGDKPLPEKCTGDLENVLLYHVAREELRSDVFGKTRAFETFPYLSGQKVFVKSEQSQVKVNRNSTVLDADLEASNGIIHTIDTVLIPDSLGTVVDALSKREEFISLLNAATVSNLATTLAVVPNITLFAPVNEAFSEIGSVPAPVLTQVLLQHVLGNRVRASQLVKGYQQPVTLKGDTLTIFGDDSGFKIFGSGQTLLTAGRITATDIATKNGIIHTISRVLIPQNIQ